MTKPDNFPQDIWEAAGRAMVWADDLFARKVTKSERREVREAVASLLLEERNECARRGSVATIAAFDGPCRSEVALLGAMQVGNAIRKGAA